MSSTRERAIRRANRRMIATLVLILFGLATVILYLSPRESEKPLLTFYEREDSECCHRWAAYARSRGFRVKAGVVKQWEEARARAGIPASTHACHTAVVDGLLIEGHVPADVVRRILRRRDHEGFVALIVPGMPRRSGLPSRAVLWGRPP